MKKVLYLFPLLLSAVLQAQTIEFEVNIINDNLDEYVKQAVEYASNRYVIVLSQNNENTPTPETFRSTDIDGLIKINEKGEVLTQTTFPNIKINDIAKIGSDKLFCVGRSYGTYAWSAVIDTNLNIISEWTKFNLEPNSDLEHLAYIFVQDNAISTVGETVKNSMKDSGVYLAKFSKNGQFIKDTILTNLYPVQSTYYLFDAFADYENNNSFWFALEGASTTYADLFSINADFHIEKSIPTGLPSKSHKWFNKDYLISGGTILNVSNWSPGTIGISKNDLFFAKQHKDSTLYVFPPFAGFKSLHGKEDTSEYRADNALDFKNQNVIYLGGTSNHYKNYQPYLELSGFHDNNSWFFITCLDSLGNLRWQRYFGGEQNYYLMNILSTNDNGVLLLGTTFNPVLGVNRRNVKIIKVKNDIQSVTQPIETSNNLIQFYPNPTNDFLYIVNESNDDNELTVTIYSCNGQMVFTENLSAGTSIIPVYNFAKGVYFYQVTNKTGQHFQSGNFVKQ